MSLFLVFTLGIAWAVTYYSASQVIKEGKGAEFTVVPDEDITVDIEPGSLDVYLNEEGVDEVEITVDTVDFENGDLEFAFGPSGAHFTPSLRLTISGPYLEEDLTLLDENGEALEYTVSHSGNSMTFYIPHFSSYYYDDYDDY